MPPFHFGFELCDDVFCAERPAFFRQNDLKSDVQQQITQLGLQVLIITGHHGVTYFMRFFEQVGQQRAWSLGGVPGTVVPQKTNEREGAIKLHRVHGAPILLAL
jgi:hypothetical protein